MIKNTKFVNKSWGNELWVVNDKENDYCGKILEIDPGKGTSLHFHSNKHETFFVLDGSNIIASNIIFFSFFTYLETQICAIFRLSVGDNS